MRITHPRPELGRQTFLDVSFIDGVAEVLTMHPIRRQALEQHGFTFIDEQIDIGRLRKPELLRLADAEGLVVPRRASVKMLRAMLNDRLTPPAPAVAAVDGA